MLKNGDCPFCTSHAIHSIFFLSLVFYGSYHCDGALILIPQALIWQHNCTIHSILFAQINRLCLCFPILLYAYKWKWHCNFLLRWFTDELSHEHITCSLQPFFMWNSSQFFFCLCMCVINLFSEHLHKLHYWILYLAWNSFQNILQGLWSFV